MEQKSHEPVRTPSSQKIHTEWARALQKILQKLDLQVYLKFYDPSMSLNYVTYVSIDKFDAFRYFSKHTHTHAYTLIQILQARLRENKQ